MKQALVLCLISCGCGCGTEAVDLRELDIFFDSSGCAQSCEVDNFAIRIVRGGCLFAWREGLGPGLQVLKELALEPAETVQIQVLGYCGSDTCARCVATGELEPQGQTQITLPLRAVGACATPPRPAPCARCYPGPDATCDGNTLIRCTVAGEISQQLCPQGCLHGRCAECEPAIFYRDRDGDGYGDSTTQESSCSQLAGFVSQGGDCDDEDGRAHPDQQAYFSTPRNSQGGYDFNCDYAEEPQYPSDTPCQRDPATNTCSGGSWSGSLPPGCGGAWYFSACELDSGFCSEGSLKMRAQPCR